MQHRRGSPVGPEAWREWNVNRLTDLASCDEISGFPVYKALLCDVVKVEEGTEASCRTAGRKVVAGDAGSVGRGGKAGTWEANLSRQQCHHAAGRRGSRGDAALPARGVRKPLEHPSCGPERPKASGRAGGLPVSREYGLHRHLPSRPQERSGWMPRSWAWTCSRSRAISSTARRE